MRSFSTGNLLLFLHAMKICGNIRPAIVIKNLPRIIFVSDRRCHFEGEVK